MVIKILNLLEERKTMSLKELEISLDMQKSAIEDMLQILIRKGKIKELDKDCFNTVCNTSIGSGCKKCNYIKDKTNFKFYTIA